MKKASVAVIGLMLAVAVVMMVNCEAQDSEPPQVSITIEPTDTDDSEVKDDVVKGVVNVVATATDNVGVDTLRFYLNGEFVGNTFTSPTGDTEDTYVYEWHSQDLRKNDGDTFEIQAKAWDGALNEGVSNTLTYVVRIPNVDPEPATVVSPEDDAVIQKASIILKWVGTDPDEHPMQELEYDLYFGEGSASNLEMVAESLSGGITPDTNTWGTAEWNRDTNILKPETDYYWKVVTRDPYDLDSETDLFHFMRGENRTPGVRNPIPADTFVPISPPEGDSLKLSWEAGDADEDPLVYDLYFSEDPGTDPVFVSHLELMEEKVGQPNYWIHLSPGATYYWFAVPFDPWGATPSIDSLPAWRFVVAEE